MKLKKLRDKQKISDYKKPYRQKRSVYRKPYRQKHFLPQQKKTKTNTFCHPTIGSYLVIDLTQCDPTTCKNCTLEIFRDVMVSLIGNEHDEASSILNDTVYISHITNTFEKCMNPVILLPSMNK